MKSNWKEWRAGGFRFVGGSVAGVGTCFSVPELDLCFDVANGPVESLNAKKYLITHGHSDHASGIPYILSQRALNKLPAPEMYMPREMISPLTEIINLWRGIEGHEYAHNFLPAQAGDSYELKGDYFFRPFSTVHRVPSCGYTVYRRFKKLKPEFQRENGASIAKLKADGKVVEDIREEALISFTGDTQIEAWDQNACLRESKVSIMEVTYVDDREPIEEARKWGHVHLDELVLRVEQFTGETLVLTHQSRRYSPAEFRKIMFDKLPRSMHDRILIAPYF